MAYFQERAAQSWCISTQCALDCHPRCVAFILALGPCGPHYQMVSS